MVQSVAGCRGGCAFSSGPRSPARKGVSGQPAEGPLPPQRLGRSGTPVTDEHLGAEPREGPRPLSRTHGCAAGWQRRNDTRFPAAPRPGLPDLLKIASPPHWLHLPRHRAAAEFLSSQTPGSEASLFIEPPLQEVFVKARGPIFPLSTRRSQGLPGCGRD